MMGSQQDQQARTNLLTGIVAFFRSVKTTIGILVLISIGSILGTLIPQAASPDQLPMSGNSVYFRLIVILDLYRVFSSWWFILLLLLLTFNLLGCLFGRVGNIPQEWAGYSEKHSFMFELTDRRSPEELKETLAQTGSKLMHSQPTIADEKDSMQLSWVKHRVHLLGFPCIHVSIIVILIGAVIGLFYGTKGHVLILEGETADSFTTPAGITRSLPFRVSMDAFTVSHYPTGEPKDFRSDVRLIENGAEVFKGAVRVNHPVTHNGFSLYQSDYRVSGIKNVKILVKDKTGKGGDVILEPRKISKLEGAPYEMKLLSLDPGKTKRGAGVQIAFQSGDGEPRVISVHKNDPEPTKIDDAEITFVGYSPRYATGLQVGYDPGTPLVWTGCLLLILGFFLSLFTNYQRLGIALSTGKKGAVVKVFGRSRRMRREFREAVTDKIHSVLNIENHQKRIESDR